MRRTIFAALVVVSAATRAHASPPDELGIVRVLGARAASVLAPISGKPTALVAIPNGTSAADLGVKEIAPGIGMIRATPTELVAFGAAHPNVHVEVPPPARALLANAQFITRAGVARAQRNATGQGVAVGIIDTGIDPTRPDFRDPNTQASRIAWMLDYSMAPLGLHADLETKYGTTDANGNPLGAVLTGADIDMLIGEAKPVPVDTDGHGTHVASIAAGNGGGTAYIGMAPNASLIIARVSRDTSGTFENGDILAGTDFVFDRASAMSVPVVANLSLGSDFGSHDGNSMWEQTLASYVGAQFPGRAIIAAAGNSGSVVSPVHQAVELTGSHVRVPIIANNVTSGSVQIWVALRAGADVRIGLDGPDGTWVSPLSEGNENAHDADQYNSGVIFGSGIQNSPVPSNSHGAVVVWTGTWPAGTYAVTLEGRGYADLYLSASGAAQDAVTFSAGVRDGTVGLPATSASIISVGCSIDQSSWRSQGGDHITLGEPVLDAYGGLPMFDAQGNIETDTPPLGAVCYFSSAGPNIVGVPKPDLLAPGAAVIASMSSEAPTNSPLSIFYDGFCPTGEAGCFQIDATHAIAQGTSMSSPMVAGVVALLLQRDPTLTQDVIRALLQAGAHRVRGPAPYEDQTGPGELDALGALEAYDEMTSGAPVLPDATQSWMTLSEDFAVSDGSTPLTAILELRSNPDLRASMFDVSRLQPVALLGNTPLPATIVRGAAPGLFTFTVTTPPGNANQSLTLGATFDGNPIVQVATIPVALDPWTAGYPSFVQGGCATSRSTPSDVVAPMFVIGLLALRRRAR
jgi:subtilisin family serine protease